MLFSNGKIHRYKPHNPHIISTFYPINDNTAANPNRNVKNFFSWSILSCRLNCTNIKETDKSKRIRAIYFFSPFSTPQNAQPFASAAPFYPTRINTAATPSKDASHLSYRLPPSGHQDAKSMVATPTALLRGTRRTRSTSTRISARIFWRSFGIYKSYASAGATLRTELTYRHYMFVKSLESVRLELAINFS